MIDTRELSVPTSIRRSLPTNLVAGIIVFGGAVLLTTAGGSRRVVRTILKSSVERTIDQAKSRLNAFFEPVGNELGLVREWAESGRLDPADPDAMNDLLQPLIRAHPQVSSLMVADERGREHMLLRIGRTWTSRQTRRDEWGTTTRWRKWTDADRTPVMTTRDLDYDPRERPWYVGALAARDAGHAGVHWTRPYTFATTKDPGMTASVAFTGPDGRTWVIGFDVLLNDLSAFTDDLMVEHQGIAFVLSDALEFIGLPRGDFWSSEGERLSALLRAPAQVRVPLIADAAAALYEAAARTAPRRFESEGTAWWGHTEPFPLAPDNELWIAVAIPEADLLGPVTTQRILIVVITLAVLAFAIVRAVRLSGRYSRPIVALVAQSDRISRGNLEPGPPIESGVTEVVQLAEAHDRMRGGLQSLMKLERDLQVARQIQQSTFPERLPTLDGYQIEAWSESADETGGDTYDVIGYTFDVIGVEPEGHVSGRPRVRLTIDGADRAVMLLADATGHGIGPALSVAQVRSMLRMAVRMNEDLGRIARLMNEELCADLPAGRFITAWLGVLDTRTHGLHSFSAGQGPILHYRAKDDVFSVRGADTLPFGILADLAIVMPEPVKLERGDLFAVISDGIFEAADPDGDQFGKDRVQAIIRTHRSESPTAIVTKLREAVDAFTTGAPPDDDRTAIVLKRS